MIRVRYFISQDTQKSLAARGEEAHHERVLAIEGKIPESILAEVSLNWQGDADLDLRWAGYWKLRENSRWVSLSGTDRYSQSVTVHQVFNFQVCARETTSIAFPSFLTTESLLEWLSRDRAQREPVQSPEILEAPAKAEAEAKLPGLLAEAIASSEKDYEERQKKELTELRIQVSDLQALVDELTHASVSEEAP